LGNELRWTIELLLHVEILVGAGRRSKARIRHQILDDLQSHLLAARDRGAGREREAGLRQDNVQVRFEIIVQLLRSEEEAMLLKPAADVALDAVLGPLDQVRHVVWRA